MVHRTRLDHPNKMRAKALTILGYRLSKVDANRPWKTGRAEAGGFAVFIATKTDRPAQGDICRCNNCRSGDKCHMRRGGRRLDRMRGSRTLGKGNQALEESGRGGLTLDKQIVEETV